ncbi:MAG: response regulator [Desulfitobacteriaceae bacterium]
MLRNSKGRMMTESILNGADAVDLILSKELDVVILDIVMPRLNGTEVLQKLNSIQMKKKPLSIIRCERIMEKIEVEKFMIIQTNRPTNIRILRPLH